MCTLKKRWEIMQRKREKPEVKEFKSRGLLQKRARIEKVESRRIGDIVPGRFPRKTYITTMKVLYSAKWTVPERDQLG